MAGIAGIAQPGKRSEVKRMLDRLRHRGPAGIEVIEAEGATVGMVWAKSEESLLSAFRDKQIVQDGSGEERLARASVMSGEVVLTRDEFGVAPLYYGRTHEGALCFASEVKALLDVTPEPHELPPGHSSDGDKIVPRLHGPTYMPLQGPPEEIATELKQRLAVAVYRRTAGETVGCWFTGRLDAYALAVLARPYVRRLCTFAVGPASAPIFDDARPMVKRLGAEHHEIVITEDDVIQVLPSVIYHIESFDVEMVRASVPNYIVCKAASEYAPVMISGDGCNELFAGCDYLADLDPASVPTELDDLVHRMHNTTLQRADRCAAAHGLALCLAFLDPAVAGYALRIPAELKVRDRTRKWILRKAMERLLPEPVLSTMHTKEPPSAEIGRILSRHAEQLILDGEFRRAQVLPNGWVLDTKEELLYYRIFHDRFGHLNDLSWMGRTKPAPTENVLQ